jgi:sulfatase maturation enzyme AslB (radical SAM superfamily)
MSQTQENRCKNCFHFLACSNLCKLRAAADWEEDSFVSPEKKACQMALILPF